MKNEEQQNQPTPKHGRIVFPLYTMGKVCVDKKLINEEWKLNGFETGKGSDECFGDDVVGEPLPLDGHILNGGRTDDTDWVNATNEEIRAELKDPTFNWINFAIPLEGEKKLTIEWDYTASHKTRGYIVQMTKAGFTFENRLKHDDLEEIYSELSDKFPYWDYTLAPSKTIEVAFPDRDPRYYVVEVDWIVADTPRKFVSSFIVEYKDDVSPIGLNTNDGECL